MDTESLYHRLQKLPEAYLWLLVLLLATYVRFQYIQVANLWSDEAFSALLSVQSPAQIWYHTGHDVHPPLYYLLLHLWITIFGDGVFSLRAMSGLAGVLGTLLAMWLMRILDTRRTALLSGLLVALFPIAVRYSQETRMYALEAVWLLGATLALVYWVRSQRVRYLLAYAVLMAAALYTHYFAIFCALAHWTYLAITALRRDRATHPLFRPAWWLANLGIAVAYLPWLASLIDSLFTHFTQLQAAGSVDWVPAPTLQTLPSALWTFFTLRDGLDVFTPVYLLLPLCVTGLSLFGAFQLGKRSSFGLLLSLHAFLPIMAVFLVSFIVPAFVERYLAFAALGLPMLMAVALDRLLKRAPAPAVGALLLILAVQGLGVHNVYAQQDYPNDPHNEQDNPVNDIVAYVSERFIAGDSIVAENEEPYYSVVYYNRTGTRPLLFQPPWDDSHHNRPNGRGASTLIYDQREQLFFEDFEHLPASIGKRVWWITSTHWQEETRAFPADWTCLFAKDTGHLELRLYVTGRPATAAQQTPSRNCDIQ